MTNEALFCNILIFSRYSSWRRSCYFERWQFSYHVFILSSLPPLLFQFLEDVIWVSNTELGTDARVVFAVSAQHRVPEFFITLPICWLCLVFFQFTKGVTDNGWIHVCAKYLLRRKKILCPWRSHLLLSTFLKSAGSVDAVNIKKKLMTVFHNLTVVLESDLSTVGLIW